MRKDWSEIDSLIAKGIPFKEIIAKHKIHEQALFLRRYKLGLVTRQPEYILQKSFIKTLDCPYSESVRFDLGIIDVLTDEYIYELKMRLQIPVHVNTAVGQLLRYNFYFPGRRLCIVTDRIEGSKKLIKEINNFVYSIGIEIIEMDNNDKENI